MRQLRCSLGLSIGRTRRKRGKQAFNVLAARATIHCIGTRTCSWRAHDHIYSVAFAEGMHALHVRRHFVDDAADDNVRVINPHGQSIQQRT